MALKQYKKAYDDISAAMEDEDSNAVITNILEMIRVRKAMGGTMDDWEPEDAVKQEQEERRARTLKNMKRSRIYSAQNKMKMAMVDFSIALQLDETSF